MKLFTAFVISAFSISALASEPTLSSTLSQIEFNKNVKCELMKSSFAICLGASTKFQTCRYTSTYNCYGNESMKMKLKVKSFYNLNTNTRESVVSKIKIQ